MEPRYIPIKDLAGIPDAVPFAPKMWLRFDYENIHALRKQMNMTKRAGLAVCYLEEDLLEKAGLSIPKDFKSGFYSIGILPKSAELLFPHIYFTGHMEWMLCVPSEAPRSDPKNPEKKETREEKEARESAARRCRLRYRRGHLFIPELNLEHFEKEELSRKLGHAGKALRLLRAAKQQKKGAVLIIADSEIIEKECARLCGGALRGIRFETPESLLDNVTGTEQLLRLSSIDGALLVDVDGNCHACGVILDGRAAAGSIARGSRYNSTLSYMASVRKKYRNLPAAGIVVSEDGMSDILGHNNFPRSN